MTPKNREAAPPTHRLDVQLEDGFVRVANTITTALALAPWDSASQPRLLLALIRTTYGMQRKEADIGTADWRALTGLNDKQIRRARQQLEEAGALVMVRDFDARTQTPARWRLEKDPTRWGKYAVDAAAIAAAEDTATGRRRPSADVEKPAQAPRPAPPPADVPSPHARGEVAGATDGGTLPPSTGGEQGPRTGGGTPSEPLRENGSGGGKDRKDRTIPPSDDEASSGSPPREAAAAAGLGDVIHEALNELGELSKSEDRRPFMVKALRITTGLDTEVWRDPKGEPAPMEDRPRLLKSAVYHWAAEKAEGRDREIRSCLRYVVAQQLDPHRIPEATTSRGPTSRQEGAHYAAHRAAAAKRGEMDPTPDEASRIATWKKEHPEEAAAIWAEVKAWAEDDQEYRKLLVVSRPAAEKWLAQRVRGMVLEAMNRPDAAAS